MSFFIGGKEFGNTIYQRANGTFEARYTDSFEQSSEEFLLLIITDYQPS